jgi:hypothetical protein
MAKLAEVLEMLAPSGWVCTGENFDSIQWIDETYKITKKQYEDGLLAYDAWKIKKDADEAAQKLEILNRLGITADELRIALGL